LSVPQIKIIYVRKFWANTRDVHDWTTRGGARCGASYAGRSDRFAEVSQRNSNERSPGRDPVKASARSAFKHHQDERRTTDTMVGRVRVWR
jgi:hypothetical protein